MMTKEEWKEIYELGLRIVAEFDEVQPGFYDRLWVWPKEFLAEAGDTWTIEEFLEWQRKNSRPNPKQNLGRMVEQFDRSDDFKQLVEEVREEHGINVNLMRGMTRKECEVWAMYAGQPDVYYRWAGHLTADIYDIMDAYELARPWYGYVLSCVLYGEGSAGFNTLSNAWVISRKTNPVTREWDLKLEVSADVVGYDVAKAVRKVVGQMKEDMLGERGKKRVRGPQPLGAQELWVKLRFDKHKKVDEICRMMKRLHSQADDIKEYYDKTYQLLPDLDPDIKDIYKGRPAKKVVKRLLSIAYIEPYGAYIRPRIRKAISRAKRYPPTYEPPDLPPHELERLARKRPDYSF